MCNKLFQIYACNHSKLVCTTPCPHALDTGPRVPINSATGDSRSNSTISSISPSFRESAVNDLAPQRQSRSPMSSSLRLSTPARRSPPPAFRFVALPPAPADPPPSYQGRSITSPISPRSTWSGTSQAAVSPTTPNLPVPTTSPARPDEEFDIEPAFCEYYFPRYLAQSKQPCLECYMMMPEWESLRRKWVKNYQLEHFVGESGNGEGLTGVEELRRRYEERMRESV